MSVKGNAFWGSPVGKIVPRKIPLTAEASAVLEKRWP